MFDASCRNAFFTETSADQVAESEWIVSPQVSALGKAKPREFLPFRVMAYPLEKLFRHSNGNGNGSVIVCNDYFAGHDEDPTAGNGGILTEKGISRVWVWKFGVTPRTQ